MSLGLKGLTDSFSVTTETVVKESSKRAASSKSVTRQPVLARKARPKPPTMKTTYTSSFGRTSRPSSRTSSCQSKNYLDGVVKGTERVVQLHRDSGQGVQYCRDSIRFLMLTTLDFIQKSATFSYIVIKFHKSSRFSSNSPIWRLIL